MKIIFLLIASACLALGAAGDYELRDDLTLLLEDSHGNKVVAGRVCDHIVIQQAKVQAACEAKLNAKFAIDKKQAVKDAKALKDVGVVIPAQIVDDTESWIETDANDPVKAKALKDAQVVPPAEGIGAQISEVAKEKINNAK